MRLSYLKSITEYRNKNRPIRNTHTNIYTHEAYIRLSCTKKSWSYESIETLTVPVSKGQRAIILHAGGQEGFFLAFKSGTKSRDYHLDMNFDNFYKWL